MTCSPARALATLLTASILLPLTACGAHQLQGTVVSGTTPSVQWVNAKDPRLDADGLASARITVLLDPERFNPKTIGESTSDGAGRFSVSLHEPGAGLLLMDVEVRAERPPDHGTAFAALELPRRGQRLLITLPAGTPATPRPGNLIDRTLDDAKPYLDR